MPTNIIDVDSFDTATTPIGSDVRNAASVTSAIQKLANRTRYLYNRILVVDADPTINGLRLTLTSAVPVTSSDVTNATQLYFTPFISGAISLYTGSAWVMRTTVEVSLALGTLVSGKNYDVFASWTGAAVALELSAAWASDTVRTDAIATQNGVQVKSGSTTKRLVGTIRTTSTTATEDSAARRFVWNGPEPSRQVPRHMIVVEPTLSWTYTTPVTWRQARATSSNRVQYVTGSVATLVKASSRCGVRNSVVDFQAMVGIGIDSTTVNSAQTFGNWGAAAGVQMDQAEYDGYPGLGYHAINWLELMGGAGTATFYSTGGATTGTSSGVRALIAA
jgi:hypothetical protein